MSKSPDLAGALAAMKAASRGPRRRSPVYLWLAEHHDALVNAFRQSQPSWTALADYLSTGGVMGADGIPAKPAAVRSTWLRVQADVARKRAKYTQQAVVADPIPPPSPASGLPDDRAGDDDIPNFSTFVRGS